jgi:(1->4)-alpha-D-glucan 1-alpha-D-glucosylmutase
MSNGDSRTVSIPRATYRVQLNRNFTFNHATAIVPYLARLGISHLYVSPILKARPGSAHGYDVTDHNALNPELGTEEDFNRLVETLHQHQMGLIVDIVPNHQGVMGDDNPWWMDVLENGPASEHASFFDIDWHPTRSSMRNRVLVPVLGEPYGVILERGELKLEFDAAAGSFSVRYFQHRFPIDPREYPRIFSNHLGALDQVFAVDDPNRADFESLLDGFGRLPPRDAATPEARTERLRDKEVLKRRLLRLIERCPEILKYIERTVQALNGVPGDPRSFDALDALLEAQAYRLAYWRVAVEEINYRRFFDVNDLAALRMNEPAVFQKSHRLIFELMEQGKIDGLRIDHPDGLYDPQEYFERLQDRAKKDACGKSTYVVVEKILAAHERLPSEWSVQGTTGYEFAALATGWLVNSNAEQRMTRIYREYTGQTAEFEEIAYRSKKLVMRASLAAEVAVLATQLDRIAQLDRRTADFTRAALRDALMEVIAYFPVYRTYISHRGVSDEDRRIVHWAVGLARKRSFAADLTVFDFLQEVLLDEGGSERPEAHRRAMREFAMKFQQVTAPVTAKGIEDTAFYLYNRHVCLNEVGGDLRRFGYSTGALHQENQERAKQWPHSMLASSTHDTKRSEDVRARIAVLSELPDLWRRHLSRWTRLNRSRRRQLEDGWAPTRNDEYLLYQTLIGTWTGEPDATYIKRIQAYMIKAARESKAATSWMNPNADYERALSDFVAALLARTATNAFVKDFTALAERVSFFGSLNSLSQTALKLTCPGVPDFYQGTELPNFSLVDPDNRRPVDYEAIQRALDESLRASPPMVEAASAKLFLIHKLLDLRRRIPDLFACGAYEPVRVTGQYAEHVCAFWRTHEANACLVVVPRWMATLTKGEKKLPLGNEVWGDTVLEIEPTQLEGSFTDVLTGRELRLSSSVRVGEVLERFPVAVLLTRQSSPSHI